MRGAGCAVLKDPDRLTAGQSEAFSNRIKVTVRMAYGFHRVTNLIALVMPRCGGLDIRLPQPTIQPTKTSEASEKITVIHGGGGGRGLLCRNVPAISRDAIILRKAMVCARAISRGRWCTGNCAWPIMRRPCRARCRAGRPEHSDRCSAGHRAAASRIVIHVRYVDERLRAVPL